MSEDFIVFAEARNLHESPALGLDMVALVAEFAYQFTYVFALVLEVNNWSIFFYFIDDSSCFVIIESLLLRFILVINLLIILLLSLLKLLA